jgi:predicted  nucleic acid-binding Zn-ribbon protein
MVTSEAARHALYAELEHLLGTEHADTLMMSFQMAQADHIATKTDVDRLEGRFDALEVRFDALEVRFDRLEDRFDAFAAEIRGEVREMHKQMHQQFRNYSITMVGAMTALTAIFSVVVGILR